MKALVTGASSGIGYEISKYLAKRGYDIIVVSRNRQALENLKNEIKTNVQIVCMDLSVVDNCVKLYENFKDENIDVLINNAGVPYGGLFTMTSMTKLKEVYEINVFSQVLIMQLVARQMMRQRSGCIINMCSVGGIETNPGYLAYGSSKAALIWITKSVSKELGAYNIRVNGIAPGLIDTDMGNYKSEQELDKVIQRMSIKRMGKTDEIAKAALYIASEEASYMTGHIMVLDGGRL